MEPRPTPNILHDHPLNNVVKKDWIHVEGLKKEWRSVEQLAKAEPRYHINPYKKKDIVAGKILDRHHGVPRVQDDEFKAKQEQILRPPPEKQEIPLTSSQEYGWASKALPFSESRLDSRTNWPNRHGELSTYMYAFWKIDPDAPAAQMDIRRKPQQCQRVHHI